MKTRSLVVLNVTLLKVTEDSCCFDEGGVTYYTNYDKSYNRGQVDNSLGSSRRQLIWIFSFYRNSQIEVFSVIVFFSPSWSGTL